MVKTHQPIRCGSFACFSSLFYASRRGPGQEYVKSTLGDVILKLVSYDKSLEVDPLKIYQEMIDNEEVERPAEADRLLLEVSGGSEIHYDWSDCMSNKELVCLEVGAPLVFQILLKTVQYNIALPEAVSLP